LNYLSFLKVVESNGKYYGLNDLDEIFRSDGDVRFWEYVSGTETSTSHFDLVANEKGVYLLERQVGVAGATIYKTPDFGETWEPTSTVVTEFGGIFPHQDNLFYWDWQSGLFKSEDDGTTWNSTGAGLGHFLNFNPEAPSFYSSDDHLFVYDYSEVRASNNGGLTFKKINNNLVGEFGVSGVERLFSDGDYTVAIQSSKISVTEGINDQWADITENLLVSASSLCSLLGTSNVCF